MNALKVMKDKHHRVLETELQVEITNDVLKPEEKQEEHNPKPVSPARKPRS